MMTGAELQEIRKSLRPRLSQQGFADVVGVGRIAVSDWERGDKPVPGAVEIVARVLEAQPKLLAAMQAWRGLTDATASAARRDIPAPALPE